MLSLSSRLLAVAVVFCANSLLLAADDEFQGVLARPIMDPALPLLEVQEFISSRIPPMPETKDVAVWQKHADRMR
ncbi:MAG: hypothetical protein AB7O26_10845 [Planctomycetaceae bacterium]